MKYVTAICKFHDEDVFKTVSIGDNFLVTPTETNLSDSSNLHVTRLKDGRVGHIKGACVCDSVEFHKMYSYYYGDITRDEANYLLVDLQNNCGTNFLVRSKFDSNVLSVLHDKKMSHYLIRLKNGKFTLNYERKKQKETYSLTNTFINIHDLIRFYIAKQGDSQKLNLSTRMIIFQNRYLNEFKRYSLNDLSMKEKIGKGRFSSVYKGALFSVTADAAIKMVTKKTDDPHCFKEIDILKRITDDDKKINSIVTFYGYVKNKSMHSVTYYIVMERMSSNLKGYLQNNDTALKFEYIKLVNVLKKVAAGLDYIHSRGIIHLDVASRNILVDKDCCTVKISDFGQAAFFEESRVNNCQMFSLRWTAPELLRFSIVSPNADVYSFHVLMYEVFTFGREVPFKALNKSNLLDMLCNGYKIERPKYCPPKLYTLMLYCGESRYLMRPTMREVFNYLERCIVTLSTQSERRAFINQR